MRRVTIGLDLGHSNDHSALVIIERTQHHWVLRHANRFALGTPFTAIVEELRRLAAHPDLCGRTTLVVDATGLGAPVVEMIRRAGIAFSVAPVVITGGHTASLGSSGFHHVPKKDIVTALYLMCETGELRIPQSLPGYPELREELLHFHANIKDDGHTSFGSSREAIHDDLVMALALATWQSRPRPTVGHKDAGPLL